MERTMSDRNRDPQTGRFAPGWRGGPGRPRRAIEADYLAVLSEAVPMERWRAIVEKAVEQAASGDAKAREWLAGYLMPRPGEGSPLAEAAAAAVVGFDPFEDDVAKVVKNIEQAEMMRAVGENIDRAHEAGILGPCSSLTDTLRVALGMAPVN
jgi:hypothetical protein